MLRKTISNKWSVNAMNGNADKKGLNYGLGQKWIILWMMLFLSCLSFFVGSLNAFPDETTPALKAALALASPYEDKQYEFRADTWEREISPQKGKGVRIQLFKGQDYCFCIHTKPGSGAKIVAHVIDETGEPLEEKAINLDAKEGIVLLFKAKKTAVYLVLIRLEGGTSSTAMIVGSK